MLFRSPMSEAELLGMERTTEMTTSRVADIILDAAKQMKPGSVEYGLGRAEFAINRRVLKEKQWVAIGTVDEGPVDRNVRVIRVKDSDGKPMAVAYQYACHSTSISPEANKISADWGGISAELIETKVPGCIALPIIGCGADANPNPRGTIELSRKHGAEMASSVIDLLGKELKALPKPTAAAFTLVALASERPDRKSTRLNSSHSSVSRMPSSA